MTVFLFELKKIRQNKTFIGACLAMSLVFLGIIYINVWSSQMTGIPGVIPYTKRESIEKNLQIANRYAGEISDEKIEAIVNDYLVLFQENRKNDIQFFDIYSYYVTDAFVPDTTGIYDSEEEIQTDVTITPIAEMGFAETGKPIIIGNFKSWEILFETMSQVFIALALLVILFCSLLFANDTSKNLLPLLLSTRFGRTKMNRSKICVGIFLTVSAFVIVHLLLLFLVGMEFGFSGWDVSIQANFEWQLFDFPLGWNNLQVYSFSLFFHLISLLAVAGVTMFISGLLTSTFSTLAISLGLFFLPQMLTYIFKTGVINQFLYLFPVNTGNVRKLLDLTSQPSQFFFDSVVANLALMLGIMLVVQILLEFSIYERMKKLTLN
ncbi:ABC transporter permease [Enterococcus saccharolyticus]|uniref:ABC transporter permease n=1 Tax=Enterococcus saccharolyticus TaxID=41997 RepID=UPI001E50827A|nr:ABC transporter permease [Enterococcus saccharolyticus]MCD5000862.1 ABC transporter permease [Enterococcus saccharolyticus]